MNFFKKIPIKIQHLKYVLSDYHCPSILISLEYVYYLSMFSFSLWLVPTLRFDMSYLAITEPVVYCFVFYSLTLWGGGHHLAPKWIHMKAYAFL